MRLKSKMKKKRRKKKVFFEPYIKMNNKISVLFFFRFPIKVHLNEWYLGARRVLVTPNLKSINYIYVFTIMLPLLHLFTFPKTSKLDFIPNSVSHTKDKLHPYQEPHQSWLRKLCPCRQENAPMYCIDPKLHNKFKQFLIIECISF